MVELREHDVIENIEFKVIDTQFYKHDDLVNSEKATGDNVSPQRIFMKFQLNSDNGYVLIEDHAGISLNKYEVYFNLLDN